MPFKGHAQRLGEQLSVAGLTRVWVERACGPCMSFCMSEMLGGQKKAWVWHGPEASASRSPPFSKFTCRGEKVETIGQFLA